MKNYLKGNRSNIFLIILVIIAFVIFALLSVFTGKNDSKTEIVGSLQMDNHSDITVITNDGITDDDYCYFTNPHVFDNTKISAYGLTKFTDNVSLYLNSMGITASPMYISNVEEKGAMTTFTITLDEYLLTIKYDITDDLMHCFLTSN